MNLAQLHSCPQEGRAVGSTDCREPGVVPGMGHCPTWGWQWDFATPFPTKPTLELLWKSPTPAKIRVLSVEEAKVDLGQK